MSKTSGDFTAIHDILTGYCDDVQELIQEEAKKIAKEAQKQLKDTSPVNKKNTSTKGRYKKGWRVKNQSSRGYVHIVIHNATNPQLTHLLEKPHALRNGASSTPIVHIKPVEEYVISEYQKRVENGIKKRR